MSQACIWIGAVMIAIATAVMLWEIWKIAHSDSPAKLEQVLGRLIVYFILLPIAGLFILFGWDISYPTHLVNGKPRTYAPTSYFGLAIGLMFLMTFLAIACAVIKYRLKERRVKPLKDVYVARYKILRQEFGDDPKVWDILERTGVLPELREAERESER